MIRPISLDLARFLMHFGQRGKLSKRIINVDLEG